MMPFLATIARDRTGPRAALSAVVLLIDAGLLGPEYRRLKQLTAAHVTGLSQPSIVTTLRWLVERGHLERIQEPFVGALYRVKQGEG